MSLAAILFYPHHLSLPQPVLKGKPTPSDCLCCYFCGSIDLEVGPKQPQLESPALGLVVANFLCFQRWVLCYYITLFIFKSLDMFLIADEFNSTTFGSISLIIKTCKPFVSIGFIELIDPIILSNWFTIL